MRLGKIFVIAVMCGAVSAPAVARPRIFRMLGALAGPMAVIGGVAGARARGRHHRSSPSPAVAASTPRPDAADTRADKRSPLAATAGPPFWAYAFDDLFGYVFGQRAAAERFWAHGYGDVLDGMFATARVSDERLRATRTAENGNANSSAAARNWQYTCASQTANPADALVERIRNAVDPRPDQNSAIDALKDALTRAAARIQAACPAASAGDAPDRLDQIAARLLAMRQAGIIVLTPLRNFYAKLDDDQKARLNAADTEPASNGDTATAGAAPPSGSTKCTSDGVEWPATAIARRVTPRREQFKDLEMLRLTSASFEQFVATTCVADKVQTAPDRLDAAQKRLNVMRYAVTHVSPAVDQVYASLSATQRARFSSLGR